MLSPLRSRRPSKTALIGVGVALFAFIAVIIGQVVADSRSTAIDEILRSIVDRGAEGISPADEGRLVRIAGRPSAGGQIRDLQTGFAISSIALHRDVEMWQAVNLRDPYTNSWVTKLGWQDRPVLNPDYRVIGGPAPITNPPFPFAAQTLTSGDVRIGSVRVDSLLASRSQFGLGRNVSLEAMPLLVQRFPDRNVDLEDGWVRIAADPTAARLGDIRVRYTSYDQTAPVTVIGRQSAGMLRAERVDHLSAAVGGDQTTSDLLESDFRNGPTQAWCWGVAAATLTLAVALAFFATTDRQRHDSQDRTWATWEAFLRMLPENVGAFVVFILILPFAIVAAPAALALAVLAHWTLQTTTTTIIGGVVTAAIAICALFLQVPQSLRREG